MADFVQGSHHVTAILVVHDGAMWLPEVVASLASQTWPIDYTLAVDTGSEDASLKLLKNARVPSLSLPRDTGFGAAVGAGLESLPSRSGENEWIWLIHDDCAPQPGALEALLDAVEDRPQVAIAGPKLRGWYDRSNLLEAGVSIANNGARWTGLEPREYDQGQHDGIREVLSVSTAGMLIRREVFEELGGFDPNLALFRDDVDLGWRAHVAGHKVIAVTEAVAFHAEAAASERRGLDVKSAIFRRPLILDRRNAAYVLLTNSSWWLLPWLAIQLLASAILRAAGYILAKLPGYASDEVLAVALLLIRPGLILSARRMRRKQRLISSRVVSTYIPPRWSQLRLGILRASETFRHALLPSPSEPSALLDVPIEDEDLLAPTPTNLWRTAFRYPEILGILFLLLITSLWSAHRYGSLVGGALASTPAGASDLWSRYGQSWHQIGMGSSSATPTWILILALLSTLFFGNAVALVTVLFWAAPLLFMWSMYMLLRKLSRNSWLTMGASVAYALSPVSIAAINSGRLGTIAVLIIGPRLIIFLTRVKRVDDLHWRTIFGFSLLVGALSAFSLQAYLGIILVYCAGLMSEVREYHQGANRHLLLGRLLKRGTLVLTPLLLCLPWSFEALAHPSRFLLEPGLLLQGGGPNLAFLANPGGPGSIPWWAVSPVTLVLIIASLSSGMARRFAEVGLVSLLIATLLSALSISGHSSANNQALWSGPLLSYATIAALCAGVIILNGLRQKLADVHFHYRHILAGLAIASTLLYTLSATAWVVSVGANSPVRTNRPSILPPFLAITPGVKTLVLRKISVGNIDAISFFIARESDAMLSDPDLAPSNSPELESAVRAILDGSGISSSKVLSAYGIKYLFMKNPVDTQLARAVDGLGGFIRNSSTQAGVVWRVAGISDRLVFTDASGKSIALPTGEVSARVASPGVGILSLAENYDSSWQIIQNGSQLRRSRNSFGLPQFVVPQAGEFSLIHDGTSRRAWLSLEMIFFLVALLMIVPSGRRRGEIAREEQS
jgi:GT2 family glycosyltransferase